MTPPEDSDSESENNYVYDLSVRGPAGGKPIDKENRLAKGLPEVRILHFEAPLLKFYFLLEFLSL